MEKDFSKDCSDTDHAPGENEDDEEIASVETEMLLTATILSLKESIANKEKELLRTQEEYNYKLNKFNSILSEIKNNPFETAPLESYLSEIRSLTDQPQIPEDTCKNLPFTNVSTEISQHLNIFNPKADSLIESKQDSTRQGSFEKVCGQTVALPPNLPSTTSDKESVVSGSYTDTSIPPDCKIVDPNEGSEISYFGKGKEAVNKAFRYKKGSPAKGTANQIDKDKNRSSCESFAKKSPTESSHEASNSIQCSRSIELTVDTQSSKGECARTSPAIKRKESDFKQRYLDDSCAGTSSSKIFEVQSHADDSKISKKLKSGDDEKVSKQYPSLTALPSNKNCESTDLAQFVDQPQTEHTINEREQLYLPSTKDSSNEVGFMSNSGKTSLAGGSDISPVEREESPITDVSEEISASGNGESQYSQSSDRSQKPTIETIDEEFPSNMEI